MMYCFSLRRYRCRSEGAGRRGTGKGTGVSFGGGGGGRTGEILCPPPVFVSLTRSFELSFPPFLPEYGFDSFSHFRGTIRKPCRKVFEYGGLRYAPYDKYFGTSGAVFRAIVENTPNVPPFSVKGVVGFGVKVAVMAVVFSEGVKAAREGDVAGRFREEGVEGLARAVKGVVLGGAGGALERVAVWIRGL